MELINHHMHTLASDGKHTPLEMAEEALKRGLNFICFTDHNHRIYAVPFSKPLSESHLNEIKEAQKKFKGKLDISLGIEIDWTEEHQEIFKKQISEHNFDFILGSVHLLNDGTEYFGVNYAPEVFSEKVKKLGIKKIVHEYYHQVRLLAKSKLFDCLAHFDLIKNFNVDSSFFDEQDNFYREEVLKTLDEIKKNNLCIEINTSGIIYRCKAMFPSFWILEEAHKRNIPITIGADAHWKERIDAGLLEAYDLARKAGYNESLKFKNRKAIKVKFAKTDFPRKLQTSHKENFENSSKKTGIIQNSLK